jgi:hypothetical protein
MTQPLASIRKLSRTAHLCLTKGGGRWALISIGAVIAVASCGGQVLAPDDAGDSGDATLDAKLDSPIDRRGPDASDSANDVGHDSPADAGTDSPADVVRVDGPNPDSSACDMQPESGAPAECVLCSDDKWHCGSFIFEPCAPGVAKGDPCSPPGALCLDCYSDARAPVFQCYGLSPHVWTQPQFYACAP